MICSKYGDNSIYVDACKSSHIYLGTELYFAGNVGGECLIIEIWRFGVPPKRAWPDWNVYDNIARLQRGRRDCAPAIGGMETMLVAAISFSLCRKSTSPSKGQVSSKRAGDGLFFLPPITKQPTRLRVSCLVLSEFNVSLKSVSIIFVDNNLSWSYKFIYAVEIKRISNRPSFWGISHTFLLMIDYFTTTFSRRLPTWTT